MKKILVIDDDPGIRDALAGLLGDEGYRVETAGDGKFLDRIRTLAPDLIVLDVMLPGADGRDLARRLREHPVTATTPIIMVSAREDYRKSAFAAGADRFFPKPFDIFRLLDEIEKALNAACRRT